METRNIRDFIHLYLGCEVEGHRDQLTLSKIIGLRGNLVYLSPHEYQTPNCDKVFTRPEMYVSSQFVKPILRPLSDMTEDERKELWRLVFSQGHGRNFSEAAKTFTGRVVFIDEKTYYNVPRHVMMQGVERLAIESDGTIWADCDLHNWRHNQHETTRWLLSKGFDLFNLIPDGLAIDRKTLKTA